MKTTKEINYFFQEFLIKFKLIFDLINSMLHSTKLKNLKHAYIEGKFDLTKNKIKELQFHGNGCGFRFKNNFLIDIEFDNEIIGFTHWSLYLFLKARIKNIEEEEVEFFLNEKLKNNELEYSGKIFTLPKKDFIIQPQSK